MLIKVSDLLTEGVDLYKENWRQFLQYSFWAAIPGFIWNVLFLIGITYGFTVTTGFLTAALYLVFIVVSVWVNIGFIRVTAAIRQKKKVGSIKEELAEAKKLIWSSIGASILYGLAVIGGMFLLIIPGLILAGLFIFFGHAVAIDEKKAVDALKFSKQLVAPRWWAVIGRFLVIFIVMAVGVGVAQSFLMAPFLSASPEIAMFANTTTSTLFSILIAPFGVSTITILYLDAKKKMNQTNEKQVEKKA